MVRACLGESKMFAAAKRKYVILEAFSSMPQQNSKAGVGELRAKLSISSISRRRRVRSTSVRHYVMMFTSILGAEA